MITMSSVARPRVLLVAEDAEQYRIVGALLRSLDEEKFELTWTATYAEGLEAVLCSAFDVSLVDCRLGERTGLDFLVEAAAARCLTPIVLLTEHDERDVDHQAMSGGAADYLVKGQITAPLLERSIRYAMERGRMLQALRASEALLERVGHIARIGGWSVELASGAIHWSIEACRIHDRPTGHPPTLAQWLGHYAPASRRIVEAAYRNCAANALAFDLELQLTTATGRAVWVRSAGEAQVERGAVMRILGAFQDITARKLAERGLYDDNELLRVTLESIGDAVITTDARGQVRSLNPVAALLTGRSESDALGRPVEAVFDIVDAKTRQRTRELMTQALANEHPSGTGLDTVLIAKDGTEVDIEDSVAAIRDRTGHVVGSVLVFRDVSERKRVAQALRSAKSLLRRVLDSATELSIIATTPDLKMNVFNKGAEEMLGYVRAEILDVATPLAFHDAAEVAARGIELTAMLGRPVHGLGVFTEPSTLNVPREWTYIRKDKRRVPVLLNVSAMFDDCGTLSGYLALARDISRDRELERSRREAASQAEQANAAKSAFLANMSHELRTPLNAVIGLGYLLERTPLNEEQRSFLGKINHAGRSLLTVISNILDISKIEAGEMLLEDAELELVPLVQDIGEMLAPAAHAKGVALHVHCAAELLPRLRGDAVRLGQIVTNLLNNAIKFTTSGQVALDLNCVNQTRSAVRVRLSVQDTGIGMDAAELARLFAPFSQADASTTRRFGGTGLGLSIVRHLVDLMGGEIGVTSTVGVGSEFWVEIPLRAADTAEPGVEASLRAAPITALGTRSLAGAKILIVDDSEINREVAQCILERHGATVVSSATGAAALERLRHAPKAYDIVFMDVQMPDMDGNETTRRIRTELQLATLPIIALTAGALPSERERSLKAGMNGVLTKPFEPAALVQIVRRHMEQCWDASWPAADRP